MKASSTLGCPLSDLTHFLPTEASLRWLLSLALVQPGFSAQTLYQLHSLGPSELSSMSISEGSVLTASACRPPPWGNVLPSHRTIPRTPTWEGSPPSVRIKHLPEDKETPLCVASCRRRQGRARTQRESNRTM